MTPLIQEVAQDSLARVLEDPTGLRDTIAAVFEAPEYRWDREVNLLARIGEFWSRLVRTLFELRSDHPAAYYVLLGALVAGPQAAAVVEHEHGKIAGALG